MRSLNLGPLVVLFLFLAGAPALVAMQVTPEPQASPVVEAAPDKPEGLVYAAGEEIHGSSLGEWSARYWQWVTSLPVGENPAQEPTGALCGYGQTGPVFFIPRNMPPCTVPAGVSVFLPIAGSQCSTLEPPPFHGDDEVSLMACAAVEADRYAGIIVRVNGEVVPNVEHYRTASPVFAMQLPEDNILAVPAGTGLAVADGYHVVLRPLLAGTHEIVVHVEVIDGYALPDKTLHLTVVEPEAGN